MRSMVAVAMLVLAAIPAVAEAGPDAHAIATTMHRGVNILGWDPIWHNRNAARFKKKDFAIIKQGGFDFVRVVLYSFDHMDPDYQIDPGWLKTLDWVVENARKAKLTVILDEHDLNACSQDVALCTIKTEAFWKQVSQRYKDQPGSVLFELLNEPHDKLDGEPWNILLAKLLAIVRETNPDRTVVIGPAHWNDSVYFKELRLPENDRNIIVTFHYYEPMTFTHEGAGWTPVRYKTGATWGTPADKAQVTSDLDQIAEWGKAHDRPLELGEFGVYDGSGTPIAMRADWIATLARAAEAHGFPWAYWQFDHDFIVYDLDKDQWVTPIKDALTPPG